MLDGGSCHTGHTRLSTALRAAVWLRRARSGRRSGSRLSQRRGRGCQLPLGGETDRAKLSRLTERLRPLPPSTSSRCDCCAISASRLHLLLLVHLVFVVSEGSWMSQKTAGTSVSSLSHSQSLQRPSQIKTVVTVPRMLSFGGLWDFFC